MYKRYQREHNHLHWNSKSVSSLPISSAKRQPVNNGALSPITHSYMNLTPSLWWGLSLVAMYYTARNHIRRKSLYMIRIVFEPDKSDVLDLQQLVQEHRWHNIDSILMHPVQFFILGSKLASNLTNKIFR